MAARLLDSDTDASGATIVSRRGATDQRPRRRGLRYAVVMLSLALLASAAFLLWVNRPRTDMSPEEIVHARAASRHFDRMMRIPVNDPARIAEALASSDRIVGQQNEIALSEDMKEAFFRKIAHWLEIRSRKDPSAYAQWMRERGCELSLDRDDVETIPGMMRSNREISHSYYTGEPLPESISAYEYFRICFEGHFREAEGLLDIVSVAGGHSASYVVFIRLGQEGQHPLHPTPYPLDEEAWEVEELNLWHGYAGVSYHAHWVPPMLLRDVLRRDGEAVMGILSLGLRSRTGVWLPTTISCYWDPEFSKWRLDSVTYSNSLRLGPGFRY